MFVVHNKSTSHSELADGSFFIYARNIYIQGNTWEDPFRHELEPFVYYFEGGVTISYKHFEISYGITHKSKEYKFQPKNHTYGTILISISI